MFQILAHRTNREAIFFRLFFFENIIKIHFSRLHDKYLDFIAPLCLVIFDSFCVLLSPLPVLSPAKRKLTNSPTDDAQQQLRIRAERWSLLIKQHEMRKNHHHHRFSLDSLASFSLQCRSCGGKDTDTHKLWSAEKKKISPVAREKSLNIQLCEVCTLSWRQNTRRTGQNFYFACLSLLLKFFFRVCDRISSLSI